jgi:hypothetical protein
MFTTRETDICVGFQGKSTDWIKYKQKYNCVFAMFSIIIRDYVYLFGSIMPGEWISGALVQNCVVLNA